MISSLRRLVLLVAALALPAIATSQPAATPPASSSFKARADAALARYSNANMACDDAGKRAAAEELNALADEARTQLSTVRAAGQFARVTLAQAQQDVSDVTLAIQAARALPRVDCPPGRQPARPPAPPQPGPGAASPPTPGNAPQPSPRASRDDEENEPDQLGLGDRMFPAIVRLEDAADNCNIAEMDRQLAILEELVVEGRRKIQASRAAGQFGTINIPRAQRELAAVEGYRDTGRRIAVSARERCLREGPRRPYVPMPLPGTGEREPPARPAVNIMDPNFIDPGTEQAREAAADYEEARQACDDEAMRAARLRLERHLEIAEETAAYGATVQGSDARTLRLKEIANNRVRDIRALIDGLRGVPVNCPSENATPAPPPTTPPAEAPAVPRQRAIRGLFGMGGVGWLKESETDLGFASLGGGYRFGEYFGIEGEAAIGIVDEEHEALGFRDSFGIDFDLAAYATVYLPVGENADLFARAGYGHTQFGFSAEGPGFSFEESTGDDSFRYGLGGQIYFDEANGVRVTWTRWDEFEEDGIDADVFVISYIRKFGGTG